MKRIAILVTLGILALLVLTASAQPAIPEGVQVF